jgi:DNA modification methylase
VNESPIPVSRCLDPFAGSGTTALACQFLGVRPTTIELNPYLADLVEAKLACYDSDALADSLGKVVKALHRSTRSTPFLFRDAPPTLIEPGHNGRWIFDRAVATRISALLDAIGRLTNVDHVRLFRVLLGGILIDISNVVVSGKGRRYRRRWSERELDPRVVEQRFSEAAQRAIAEIHRYSKRACTEYDLLRGDCRELLTRRMTYDLAVFSPPYPNSFDYTDVYNVELWTLGYLSSRTDNTTLRTATLCSHVQIARQFPSPPVGSVTLDRMLARLVRQRPFLWDHRIPEMVGGYFADMALVLKRVREALANQGLAWIVVGDSRYSTVRVRTGRILAELAQSDSWTLRAMEPCRSMRASAQQGGRRELSETLLVLQR